MAAQKRPGRQSNSYSIRQLKDGDIDAVTGLKSVLFSSYYEWGPKALSHACYHKYNVEFGYRPNLDFFEAFTSLFMMHNETMNIWSHLIGFGCAIGAVVYFILDQYVYYDNMEKVLFTHLESIMFGAFVACAAICFLLSSIYHWFMCLSPSCSTNLLRWDLTGVALLVGSSYIPGMYFGFYCLPRYQYVYLTVSFLILTVGLISPWVDYEVRGRPIQAYVFALLVGIGLVPCTHWFLLTPPVIRDKLYWGMVLLFFWYGCGFFFYITAIPELFFPKRFWAVIILSSHTLWHICVLFAVFTWFHYIWEYKSLLHEMGCALYDGSG